MGTVAEGLSLAEFELKYGHSDCAYEYWHGQAIAKAMPTSIHGLVQGLTLALLREAGFKAATEVDLRIDPKASPRPDVIATRGRMERPHPTRALEIVVEILSPGDSMTYLLEKCESYKEWGFEYVYVIDPDHRKLYRWTGMALEIVSRLVEIPVERIWSALDEATH